MKIYKDELQKNGAGMLQEGSEQADSMITSTHPDDRVQKVSKEKQQPMTTRLSPDQSSDLAMSAADYNMQENQQQVGLEYHSFY